MKEINLTEYANGADSIWGRSNGEMFALKCQLPMILNKVDRVVIIIDESKIKAINDSFIKGFFTGMFKTYKTRAEISKRVEIQSSLYFKRLFDKNWAIMEAIYK